MPKGRNYLVRNQTPGELVLLGADHVIRLSPLQNRTVRDHPIELFGQAARFAKHDHAVDWEAEPVRARRLVTMAWFAGIAFAGLAVGVAGQVFGLGTPAVVVGAVWCVLFLGVVLALSRMEAPSDDTSETSGRRTPVVAKADSDWWDLSPRHADWWELVRDLGITLVQGLVGVVLLIVAVGAPALAIYYGTELSDVIKPDGWNHWHLTQPGQYQYVVVARCLQLGLLILMSILPGLMFYQFDREKLSTLVDRWLHAIFRLDPSLHTVSDVDARYGRRVEEYFGASLEVSSTAPRRRLRNRSPVVTTTLLIAIGWIVVLVNTRHSLNTLPTLQDLFNPIARPMALAFLGAYFLTIQVVLRGYIRGDLKPKTYNVLSVRIIMAVILSWVLQVLAGSNTTTLALSFIAGVTPNTVLRRIRDISVFDWAKKQVPSAFGTGQPPQDELDTQSPLTLLDEIDVYERTRLEEEGITCVQALARHDFVDLMLSSRIPVPRLVDWMDQAILFQHVPSQAKGLRQLSIRNASDFLRYLDRCAAEGDRGNDTSLRDALCAALAGVVPEMLAAELMQDEWLRYILNWRSQDGTRGSRITVYDTTGRSHVVDREADGTAPPMRDLREQFPVPPEVVVMPGAHQNGDGVGSPVRRPPRAKKPLVMSDSALPEISAQAPPVP